MSRRALDAAGITEPALRDAYTACLRLNSRTTSSFLLATRLLPLHCRPAVHALYRFAHEADAIVDDPGSLSDKAEREAALDTLQQQLDMALRGEDYATPSLRALAHTVARYHVDLRHMDDFMNAMRADLAATEYPDYGSLRTYCHGCAAAPGLMTAPVLGTLVSQREAAPHAIAFALALQLTNILRDVGEDLDRGRLYLPQDLLQAHGVDRSRLQWSRRTGNRDHRITAAAKSFASLANDSYRDAATGVAVLVPQVRPALHAALAHYAAILEEITKNGYDVLHRRARVPRHRRAALALTCVARVIAARAKKS
ncbi:phytoene/squalene synthase family protein [Streptomyces sp. A012304]|uniref:phytoene/squalene synthase family protein n=1 Tax=Streptomyces sp. A012304 TaxID=375446 RepID=UPI00222E9283|nr:phytoene/squalene synthase family protein [Streptomyces sp. A012304]GKQ38482.1 phytoene synthase [Streptomyces sp. A012304]